MIDVSIIKKNGSVKNITMPDLEGETKLITKDSTETSRGEMDDVVYVIDSLTRTEEGFVLAQELAYTPRIVAKPTRARAAQAVRKRGVLIVAANELDEVKQIIANGEVVYPMDEE